MIFCDACGRGFDLPSLSTQKRGLFFHQLAFHAASGLSVDDRFCDDCERPAPFAQARNLWRHQIFKHGQDCGFREEPRHTEMRVVTSNCDDCGHEYRGRISNGWLVRHCQRHLYVLHTKQRIFCDTCGKEMALTALRTTGDFHWHWLRNHSSVTIVRPTRKTQGEGPVRLWNP